MLQWASLWIIRGRANLTAPAAKREAERMRGKERGACMGCSRKVATARKKRVMPLMATADGCAVLVRAADLVCRTQIVSIRYLRPQTAPLAHEGVRQDRS